MVLFILASFRSRLISDSYSLFFLAIVSSSSFDFCSRSYRVASLAEFPFIISLTILELSPMGSFSSSCF